MDIHSHRVSQSKSSKLRIVLQEQLGPFPLLPVEVAAQQIVQAAVRRDRYIIVPGWYKLFLLYRIFAPEVMDWTNRYIIQVRPGSYQCPGRFTGHKDRLSTVVRRLHNKFKCC